MSDAALTDSTALAAPSAETGLVVVSHVQGLDLSNVQGILAIAPGATISAPGATISAPGATITNNNMGDGATINHNEGATINQTGRDGDGDGDGDGEPLATKAEVREIQQQLTQIQQQLARVIEQIGDKIKQIVTEIVNQ